MDLLEPDTTLDLELIELESWLSEDHCESTHKHEQIMPCQHTVVAVHSNCLRPTFKVCQSVVDFVVSWHLENRNCRICGTPVVDCWQITPV